MKYSQIYYDSGYSDIIVERFNKRAKKEGILIDKLSVVQSGAGQVELFATYVNEEENKKTLNE